MRGDGGLRGLWGWRGLVQREGQARHGCLKRVCAKFRKDAKQIKHTQTFALRKVGVIVRFWKGGAAIPPVVARIISGDSTSPLTREARTLCGARDYCLFARVAGMERLVGVKQSLR